jgi:hypothetical protein
LSVWAWLVSFLEVVGVCPPLVPETFVMLSKLVFVDVLEELLGAVGKPDPRTGEAQASYTRLALAIGVLKLYEAPSGSSITA